MDDAFAKEYLHNDLRDVRSVMLWKLDGLSEYDVRRPLTPTGTNLLGLVRHLTKVEHAWFVTVLAGLDDPVPFGWPAVTDGDFRLDDSDGLAADVQRYVDACERSRQILAGLSLDDVGVHWRLGTVDARWVMLHMIEEYAQHNGHADIIRELIDGTTQS